MIEDIDDALSSVPRLGLAREVRPEQDSREGGELDEGGNALGEFDRG